MKKIITILLLSMILVSCGRDITAGPHNKTYETKGFLTLNEKDPCVQYQMIPGNVIWGIILVETIFMPIYLFGFSIYEPVAYDSSLPTCREKN